jgi:hypothetical protein
MSPCGVVEKWELLCGVCCLVLQERSLISYSPRMDAVVFPEILIMFFSLLYIRFQNIVIFRFIVL